MTKKTEPLYRAVTLLPNGKRKYSQPLTEVGAILMAFSNRLDGNKSWVIPRRKAKLSARR